MPSSMNALDFDHVELAYGANPVLRDVTFHVAAGEAFGLVGESGCGKSTAALAALAALPRSGRLTAGRISVAGRDLASLDAGALRRLHARDASMVYQDAGRALNPTLSIGRQVAECFEVLGHSRRDAWAEAAQALDRVRLPDAPGLMRRLPHGLSGGQQQRVVIAMALAKSPHLLVLDEPTTGLDATVEAEIVALLAELRTADSAILLISHNLSLVARLCERTGVLYAGSLVEQAPTAALLAAPRHPYTARLLAARPAGTRRDRRLATIEGTPPPPGPLAPGCVFAPRCPLATELCRDTAPSETDLGGGHTTRCHHHAQVAALSLSSAGPGTRPSAVSGGSASGLACLLAAKNLARTHGSTRALRPLSLQLHQAETLGIVGESGSGKTTLARLLVGLDVPDPGATITLDGQPLAPSARRRTRQQLGSIQLVFQNPDIALNRAHRVRRVFAAALRRPGGLRGAPLHARLHQLASDMRMSEAQLDARPPQLSGGLKQRVAIGRALAAEPRILVCDEPTSALDVSVQAAILNLLADLQDAHGTTLVLISHDLAVVRFLADRIAVLYLGRLVELGPAASVLAGPHHPYTEALVSAAFATPQQPAVVLRGERPSAAAAGCLFHTRCPRRLGPVCDEHEPPLHEASAGEIGGHVIRCHIPRAELGTVRLPALPG